MSLLLRPCLEDIVSCLLSSHHNYCIYVCICNERHDRGVYHSQTVDTTNSVKIRTHRILDLDMKIADEIALTINVSFESSTLVLYPQQLWNPPWNPFGRYHCYEGLDMHDSVESISSTPWNPQRSLCILSQPCRRSLHQLP